MSLDAETSLARAIQEHLDLKQRNSALGDDMPIDRYEVEDPFENHPLFKSEEQARLEETMETVLDEPLASADAAPDELEQDEPEPDVSPLPWPGEDSTEGPALVDGLWGRSRDFDWGD
jgi:hypothetical protein